MKPQWSSENIDGGWFIFRRIGHAHKIKTFVAVIRRNYNLMGAPNTLPEGYQLLESPALYKALFEAENEDMDLENTYFWDVKDE